MLLTGKTAIVTGSTSGIGLAYARALAAEGASVVINGFGDADAVETVRAELAASSGAEAFYDPADMTWPDEIAAMVARAAKPTGSVDIVVAQYDRVVAIVLSSAWHLARAAVPLMRAKGWGRVIATGSAHSLVASPNKSAYVMAKHGVAGLIKTLALECATDGITANVISPGYVWTPLVENQIPDTMRARGLTREQVMNDVLLAAQPTKRFVTPEEVAALAVFLCRDEARSITGTNLSVDGGWTAA